MLAFSFLSLFSGALSIPLSCDIACYEFYSPVCGSDGKTYSNACMLGVASCRAKQQKLPPVVQVHTGTCVNADSVDDARACDNFCDEDKSPLCASNGVVYENHCRFEIARCIAARNGTSLKVISHTSTCTPATKPECEKYAVNTSDLAFEGPLGEPIKTMCPHGGHEVCTNHGTFKSECELCKYIDTMIDKSHHYSGYTEMTYDVVNLRWVPKTGPWFTVPDYQILHEGPCQGFNYPPYGHLLGGSKAV